MPTFPSPTGAVICFSNAERGRDTDRVKKEITTTTITKNSLMNPVERNYSERKYVQRHLLISLAQGDILKSQVPALSAYKVFLIPISFKILQYFFLK